MRKGLAVRGPLLAVAGGGEPPPPRWAADFGHVPSSDERARRRVGECAVAVGGESTHGRESSWPAQVVVTVRERRRRLREWIRWIAVRLLALAAIVVLVITGYRWAGEGSLSSAVRMLGDDLAVLATCPTEFGRVRDFVRRPVPESGSESSMSQRHGAGWEHEVCDGDLNLRGPAGAERAGPAAATPTLARIPNLQPQIEAAIEEALGSAPAEGTTLGMAIARAATPQPASHPRDLPAERHVGLKRLMLQLINAERAAVGLMPVALGENAAAQLHAEASLRGCFSSHWGLDGLKPYMRYSLTGGYQANAENASGLGYCITDADSYAKIRSVEQEVREAMAGWMESPGHLSTILDPWHRAVNIGLAWDRFNFVAIQHFEGGYVEYQLLPEIREGYLIVDGAATNGAGFKGNDGLGIQVYYDPPPGPLTPGQLARSYCYGSGLPVAALRPRPDVLHYYAQNEFTAAYRPCPNPDNASANAQAPRSPDEAHVYWRAAYEASQTAEEHAVTVPWVTVREWEVTGQTFAVKADLSHVIAIYGPGVYSVVVWGRIGDQNVAISEYSIFHDIDPPEGYAQFQ